MLKHAAKFLWKAANAVQDLNSLIDAIKDLRDRLPGLPPDFWSWSQGTTMDLWSWIDRLWHLT